MHSGKNVCHTSSNDSRSVPRWRITEKDAEISILKRILKGGKVAKENEHNVCK